MFKKKFTQLNIGALQIITLTHNQALLFKRSKLIFIKKDYIILSIKQELNLRKSYYMVTTNLIHEHWTFCGSSFSWYPVVLSQLHGVQQHKFDSQWQFRIFSILSNSIKILIHQWFCFFRVQYATTCFHYLTQAFEVLRRVLDIGLPRE